MIRAALFKLITSDVPTKALIAKRMFPNQFPQNVTYPAISYAMTGGPRDMTHDGPSGLVDGAFRFMIDGRTQEEAMAIKRALVSLLSGYEGTVNLGGGKSVEIQGVFVINENDAIESPLGDTGGPLNITRDTLDINIWYVET